jgi:hypothetical protein
LYLNDDEDNVTTELSNEIIQTLNEQKEDLGELEQQVEDLVSGRAGSQHSKDKNHLRDVVKRAARELKL